MQFNDVSPRRKTALMVCIQKINCKMKQTFSIERKKKHLMVFDLKEKHLYIYKPIHLSSPSFA